MENNMAVANKRRFNTRSMVMCALFTALIAIGAFIRIPLPVTVFTMQFIFVLLSGLLLGSRGGALACFMYVAIGLIGFPVFTEGGGLGYVLKPTFGYLVAFIITSFIVGKVREKYGSRSFAKLFAGCVSGMVVTYAIGTVYTYLILNYVMGSPIPYWACLVSLFPVTALKDLASCAIAAGAAKRLIRAIKL